VSLSVYPTEGSGKTCKKIIETAHTLGGYIGCEPIMAAQEITLPRGGVSSITCFTFKVYQTFRYR